MKNMIKSYNKKTDPGLVGLKRHSHEDRQKVIDLLVPILENLLGDNLVAIASSASFARGDDKDFSDLEMNIFVREKPKEMKHGFSRVIDGLLVEGLFFTQEDYIKETLDITGHWYLAGSDVMEPVTNPEFFHQFQNVVIKKTEEKILNTLRGKMHGMQENFGKLFTAIEQENRESLFIIFLDAVNILFQVMSYINQTPYTTLALFTQEARQFEVKPDGFEEFLQIAIDGDYQDLEKLEETAIRVYGGIEKYVMEKSGKIYNDDLGTIGKEVF